MTECYRERRLRKAERLREWAAKREEKAAAVFDNPLRRDHAFNTQPGHIPARARLIAQEDRAFESLKVASSMQSRSDNIKQAADRAIYSDDPDVTDRLETKIAELEAEQDRIKQYNASCRCGAPDETLLNDSQRATLDNCRRVAAYQLGKNGAFPSYALSNLNTNINRLRKRLREKHS